MRESDKRERELHVTIGEVGSGWGGQVSWCVPKQPSKDEQLKMVYHKT